MFLLPLVVPLAAAAAPTQATTQPAQATTQPAQATTQPARSTTQPTQPTTPPSDASEPTQPTQTQTAAPSHESMPVNPVTGRPLQIDPQTGALIIPRDPTTGLPIDLVDEAGQPIVLRDQSGQEIPSEQPQVQRADSLLRAEGRGGSFDPIEQVGRGTSQGGKHYHLRVGLVEGYTSNSTETQASATAPIIQHPALFTGLEGSADLFTWSGEDDPQTFRVSGRLQHYIPIDGNPSLDDGTLNGSWGGAFTLDRRTIASMNVVGTLTSSNSALISDGPLFQADPSTFTHVYTLENARLTVSHELSPRWRIVVGGDAWVGTTVSEAPLLLPNGANLYHSGLDYVTSDADISFNHDFGPADIGSIITRYSASFVAFVLNYAAVPPSYRGTAWNQAVSSLATWTHAFDQRLRMLVGAGASVSQAPPLDTNQQPVLSPAVNASLIYSRAYWLTTLGGSYSYGSANPRLGFGPSEGGSLTIQGLPSPRGTWSNLALLATGSVGNATFAQGGGISTQLVTGGASLEARYALNRWLGLAAGYNFVYVNLEGPGSTGPLVRNIVFAGLSGYFANDGTLPTLESFALAISPPG
jgi:hypothetical protein